MMWILIFGAVAAWCTVSAAAALALGCSIAKADRHVAAEGFDARTPDFVPAHGTARGTATA